jgi:hypothetical protein
VSGAIRIASPTVVHGSPVAAGHVDANNTLTVDGAAHLGSLKVASPAIIRGETAFSEGGCRVPSRSP